MEHRSRDQVSLGRLLVICIWKYKKTCLLGIGAFLMGAAFIVLAWGGHLQSKKVVKGGGRAKAVIIDKKTHSHMGTKKIRRTDYVIYYTFTTQDKGIIRSSYTISKNKWVSLEIDDSIEVAYDFDHPEYNFPVGSGMTSGGLPIVLSVFSLFPLGFGSLVLYGFLVNLCYRWYKILNHGVKSEGTITEIRGNKITYEFTDYKNRTHNKQSDPIKIAIVRQLNVGNTGGVLYEESKPKNSVWIGNNWRDFL